jgi:hypothetical protein
MQSVPITTKSIVNHFNTFFTTIAAFLVEKLQPALDRFNISSLIYIDLFGILDGMHDIF